MLTFVSNYYCTDHVCLLHIQKVDKQELLLTTERMLDNIYFKWH